MSMTLIVSKEQVYRCIIDQITVNANFLYYIGCNNIDEEIFQS